MKFLATLAAAACILSAEAIKIRQEDETDIPLTVPAQDDGTIKKGDVAKTILRCIRKEGIKPRDVSDQLTALLN